MLQGPRTRRVARALMSALVSILLLVTPAGLAAADPQAVDDPTDRIRQLFDTLGVGAAPAQYFIVLDVSTSMLEEHGYDQAKEALRTLLPALTDGDRITVIRFGETTTPFRGPLPAPRGAGAVDDFLAALPTPTDQASDFGAAMDDVADIIRRSPPSESGRRPPTAILVLTDAELYAPDNPDFAERRSPGWARVANEYAALAAERGPIAAYALPLGTNARGVNLIREVMPNAASLTGTVAEQSEKLAELHDDTNRHKAVELVDADANATVRASFTQGPATPPGDTPDGSACTGADPITTTRAADLTRERDLCLELTSTANNITLTVDDLAAQSDDLTLELPTGSVELRPGETVRRIVRTRTAGHRRISLTGEGRDYRGHTRVTGRVHATDAADFASLLGVPGPYVHSGLVDDGGITYIGRVHGVITWYYRLLLGVLVLLVALIGRRAYVALGPLPRGLRVEFDLDGRTEYFPGLWPMVRRPHRLVWDKRQLTEAVTTFRARRPWFGRDTAVVKARHRHGPVTLNTVRRVGLGAETMMYGVKVRLVDASDPPRGPARAEPPVSSPDAMVIAQPVGEEPTATPVGVLVTTPPPSG